MTPFNVSSATNCRKCFFKRGIFRINLKVDETYFYQSIYISNSLLK